MTNAITPRMISAGEMYIQTLSRLLGYKTMLKESKPSQNNKNKKTLWWWFSLIFQPELQPPVTAS